MMRGRLAFALVLFTGLMLNLGPVAAQDGLPNLAWLDPPRQAPDVAYLIEGGEVQTLDSFRGKVVVLNFWATWCPPCVAEMPYLDELAGTHGGDHLVVVTMAMEVFDA